VTCVLGDNGAGKSTLIKIIAGLHQHNEGTYEVEGVPVQFGSPREALDHGIATVYQDLAVVPLMPVWRNFFLGNEVRKGIGPVSKMDIGFMRQDQRRRNCPTWASTCADVEQPIGTLSGGERSASPSPGPSTSERRCSSSTSRPRRSGSSSPASC
jgi:simple sugar transport system ATP-binding protein